MQYCPKLNKAKPKLFAVQVKKIARVNFTSKDYFAFY